MSDVVLLPFPLTRLWGSGKYAISNTNSRADHKSDPSNDKVIPSIEKANPVSNAAQVSSKISQQLRGTSKSASDTTTSASNTSKQRSDIPATTCSTPAKKERFEDGTSSIPEEIKILCNQIRSSKRHPHNNLLVRMELTRTLPEHFNPAIGTLKSVSPLNKWYGDTRLFSREEWLYFKGKSRDEAK